MGERILRPEDMATTSAVIATVAPPLQEEPVDPVVITLRPTAPRAQARKKVVWTEDTVDNEHMNKKKSKCCCIYEKPHRFGESDSEDSEDECEHCYGHVERRHKHRHQPTTTDTQDSSTSEPTTSLTLQPAPAPSAPPAPAPAPQPGVN